HWQPGRLSRSIWSLTFSADGQYLAAAGRQLGPGGMLVGAGGHWWRQQSPFTDDDFESGDVYAVGFAPSETTIALTLRNVVSLNDNPIAPERDRCSLPSSWAAAVVFVSERILVAAASSFLYCWDTMVPHKPVPIKTGLRIVTSLAVTPDGKQ